MAIGYQHFDMRIDDEYLRLVLTNSRKHVAGWAGRLVWMRRHRILRIPA